MHRGVYLTILETEERAMKSSEGKVDVATMNASIDKVLAYKPPPKLAKKEHETSARRGVLCLLRQARTPHSLPPVSSVTP